ncbi:MAG: DNA-binding response regulator [Allomuricauda sp.]|nr:MAG: DNA-binding response regulator [Allomuricauda sp.]
MSYTFSIVDSDAASNLQLQLHLQDYGDFSLTGTAINTLDGLNHVLKYMPDIVLVHLNEQVHETLKMVGDMHRYMQTLPLLIGFSRTRTHAYDALKNGFFDYWLLPHNEFEVRKTVLRLRKHLSKENVPTTICLKSYRDYHYLNTDDILYLKADSNATEFFMKDGGVISTYQTLKFFEGELPEKFIRIHQSYILNSDYVSRINYGKATCTLKIDKNQLPFSKTYRNRVDELKQLLSKTSIHTRF